MAASHYCSVKVRKLLDGGESLLLGEGEEVLLDGGKSLCSGEGEEVPLGGDAALGEGEKYCSMAASHYYSVKVRSTARWRRVTITR